MSVEDLRRQVIAEADLKYPTQIERLVDALIEEVSETAAEECSSCGHARARHAGECCNRAPCPCRSFESWSDACYLSTVDSACMTHASDDPKCAVNFPRPYDVTSGERSTLRRINRGRR